MSLFLLRAKNGNCLNNTYNLIDLCKYAYTLPDINGYFIEHLYEGITVCTFSINNDEHGMIMETKDTFPSTKLYVEHIYPELVIFRNLSKKIKNVSVEHNMELSGSLNNQILTKGNLQNSFHSKHVRTHPTVIMQKRQNTTSREVKEVVNKQQQQIFEKEKPKDSYLVNLNAKTYQNDKYSYKIMKEDIETGDFSEEMINPDFVSKYIVFKIMDNRNQLNLDSNDNNSTEMNIFDTLHASFVQEGSPKQKPYIPHNVHFLERKKDNIGYYEHPSDDEIGGPIEIESNYDSEDDNGRDRIVLSEGELNNYYN